MIKSQNSSIFPIKHKFCSLFLAIYNSNFTQLPIQITDSPHHKIPLAKKAIQLDFLRTKKTPLQFLMQSENCKSRLRKSQRQRSKNAASFITFANFRRQSRIFLAQELLFARKNAARSSQSCFYPF